MKTIDTTHGSRAQDGGTVRRGTGTFWQINMSFFVGGFATFITLYDVQPLLPVFSREFHVPPAIGSLPLSVATCALAVTMLLASSLSEAVGRKPVMAVSLVLTSLLAILTAFSHTFPALLGLRLAQGAVIAGLPAVAMAYLAEEIEPASLGTAMGLYIGGNAVGGMTGRIYTAAVTDYLPWRTTIGTIGILCLFLSFYFARSLPASTNFRRRPLAVRPIAAGFATHLREPALLCLFGIIFLATGAFVTLYNYVTFRLIAPPYNLSQMQVSWIFLAYLLGSCSSTLAGHLVHRFGRGVILWLALSIMILGTAATLATGITGQVAGIALYTCGFFGAHSVASSWVSSKAQTAKAQASSLYLFFYYLGSSISGTIGGVFWTRWGWKGVAGLIALLLLAALLLVVRLVTLAREEALPETAVPLDGVAVDTFPLH
ncbi:MAG TPA: MFS transporter [Geobacteraceae bacterium]|nr:MFS transporter [Geobacteraceae bacterium]